MFPNRGLLITLALMLGGAWLLFRFGFGIDGSTTPAQRAQADREKVLLMSAEEQAQVQQSKREITVDKHRYRVTTGAPRVSR